jgi:hypothetical protein
VAASRGASFRINESPINWPLQSYSIVVNPRAAAAGLLGNHAAERADTAMVRYDRPRVYDNPRWRTPRRPDQTQCQAEQQPQCLDGDDRAEDVVPAAHFHGSALYSPNSRRRTHHSLGLTPPASWRLSFYGNTLDEVDEAIAGSGAARPTGDGTVVAAALPRTADLLDVCPLSSSQPPRGGHARRSRRNFVNHS